MIAVQLSAFLMDDSIVLHSVTVLDVAEEIADVDIEVEEPADRTYWEKKSDPASMAVMDKIVSSLRSDSIEPRLTYNRHHVALGTTGYNFCWFHPRKSAGHCHIGVRVGSEARDAVLSSLQDGGIDASPSRTENVAFRITAKGLEEHATLIKDVLKRAEEVSKV